MNKIKQNSTSFLGAIIGDIVGSVYEWHNIKTKNFELWNSHSTFTDDTVMTLAVGQALAKCQKQYNSLASVVIKCMQKMGQHYSNLDYGLNFRFWLSASEPKPYESFGNGAAMRISPVAYFATSLDEVKKLSQIITGVSHNHPQGIKGAEATAVATYLALNNKTKDEIKNYITQNYYHLNFTLDEIRNDYYYDSSCQGSVPQALQAFFESINFEDAIRNAVSIGGDSDTIAAITGAVAGAYYKIPPNIIQKALTYLDNNLLIILSEILSALNSSYLTSNEDSKNE